MKRIYMALALIGALITGAKAQSIDLEAVMVLPTAGQSIGPGQTLDTDKVFCGVIYHGPDMILQTTDAVWFMTSFNRRVNDSMATINGVAYNSDITSTDSGKAIFIFPNGNEIGTGHSGPFKLSSDSIRMLYDWDAWNLKDSIVIISPPYENCKSYGLFFRVFYVGDNNADPIATDPVPGNNRAVQRIVWNCGVGIDEMMPKKEEKTLTVYPVPANNDINFEFNFDGPSHAQVVISDMTGKVVKSKNFGRALSGVQKYSLDISSLSNGIYTIQFDTDTQTGKTKFTIAR
jgi:hypothetical protein